MLQEVKNFVRVDGTDEDISLGSLISASKLFFKNTTGIVVDETNDLHELAIKLLVSNSYENRLPVGEGEKLAFSLDSILFQLKYCFVKSPVNLSSYVTNSVVDLSWDANSESDLAGYEVYQGGIKISSVITNSYQVIGLTQGTYLFQVLAFDDSGTQSKLTKAISVEV